MSSPSRRAVLRTVATTVPLLSGCVLGGNVANGHLFVENRSDTFHRVRLWVAEETDGVEPLVHGIYRVPSERALQFEGILESGTSYRVVAIQAEVTGAGEARLSVPAETCAEGDPAEKLDAVVLVSESGPDVLTYGCDRVYSKVEALNYVDPSEHRIGTVTGTVPPPTPPGS